MKISGPPLPVDVPQVAWPELSAVARRSPNKDALVTDTDSLTYDGFVRRVHQAQRLLHTLSLTAGDRMVVLLRNEWPYPVLYWAALASGIIFVPLNIRLVNAEISPILAEVQPQLIIAEGGLVGQVPFNWRGRVIGLEDFTARLYAQPDSPVSGTAVSPTDPAVILYTSGTTGKPKGVVLTHRNVAVQFYQASRALIDMRPEDRIISLYPIFHTAQHVFLQAPMTIGATAVVSEFHPDRVLPLLRHQSITVFFGVPAMYHILLQRPEFTAEHLPHIRMLTYGASIMPKETIQTLRSRFPKAEIRNLYGQTENSPAVSGLEDAFALSKPGSVGRPLPGMTIAIMDDNDRDVNPGVVGEVVTQGINLMQDYYQNHAAYDDVVRDGWYHTGDLGYLDEEGFLYIIDRKKDMIIRGGQNIYAAEIENVLHRHPDIVECAVIGVPHPIYGEEVAAAIVRRPGSSLMSDDVILHVRGQIARYKEPVHICLLTSYRTMPAAKS